MSYLLTEESICPYCKFPTMAEVWTIVNVKDDPELRDLLLGGELNMVKCDSCQKIFYADHFLIYHDPELELMAFVYPLEEKGHPEIWEEKTRVDFEQSQGNADTRLRYEPITLFGLDALIEVIQWDEEAGIQSEIVSILASEHGFSTMKVRPSLARRQRLPFVIPLKQAAANPTVQDVVSGCEMVEKMNDLLHIFTEAKKILQKNPAVALQFE